LKQVDHVVVWELSRSRGREKTQNGIKQDSITRRLVEPHRRGREKTQNGIETEAVDDPVDDGLEVEAGRKPRTGLKHLEVVRGRLDEAGRGREKTKPGLKQPATAGTLLSVVGAAVGLPRDDIETARHRRNPVIQ